MKNRCLASVCVLVLLCAPAARADQASCELAIEQYNHAVSDVVSTLKRYVNCVADSKGEDDCSTEFRRLKSAQSDFEDAISSYRSECRQ